MLFKKLLRTMGLYKAQFISMILMITLGVGMFVGFNAEWTSILENRDAMFEETGFADYRIVSSKKIAFTEETAKKIKAIDGVEAVSRYLSVNADVETVKGAQLAITVTENEEVSFFKLIGDGEKYDKTDDEGIWVSDKFCKENNLKTGDELTLKYSFFTFKGTIRGLIKSAEYLICTRDETQLMPDYKKFAFCYVSPAFLKRVTGGVELYYSLNVKSNLSKDEFKTKVNEALGETALVYDKDLVASYAQSQGEVDEGRTMGSILPVLFLAIAVLTMVTTMHRLTVKEKTQIGTLKALGFKDGRILRHYTSYAFAIGLVGSLLGVGLGFLIAWFIMNPNGAMGTYLDFITWNIVMPWFCPVVLVGMIAVLTLIGFLSVKSMLRGNAADVLRPYSPKKMKKLVLEKTPLWKNLSFGTKWNMRDVMRHKSRTLMSLVGIVGCAVLIVASFGMQDTMDAFLSDYYNDAMKYETKIFFEDNASQSAKETVIKKYSGDYSGTVYAELNGDKTIGVEVYGLENEFVRFSDENGKFNRLEGNGVYVCKRLAEEYSLRKGSIVKVRTYETSDEYDFVVSGVVRSMNENIVMTEEYAEKVGFAYEIDTVYTQTKKNEISDDLSIKGTQSRQDIIDSFDTFTELMNLMVIVLVIAAMVLGLVVLYNLGVMSYTERYREMATLKVVGFKDKKIARLLIGQNLWVTFFGLVVGIPLGWFTLDYLVNALATEYEMRSVIGVFTIIISVALVFLTSLIVSIAVARKNKKIDMVEALKGSE